MRADIKELAVKLSDARLRVQVLGAAAVPYNTEDRVKQDARYQLARDAYVAADLAYRNAIEGLTADELRELAES